jgi:hypothetical protein
VVSLTSWAASLQEKLAPHLHQLRRGLSSLGERLRQSIASSVGRTVADVVSEAVDAALATPDNPAGSYGSSRPASLPVRPRDWCDDPGESVWGRSEQSHDNYGRTYGDYDDEDQHLDEERRPHDNPKPGRLSRALAAGFQAAGWWLQRHRGRLSLLAAASVGLATGLATLLDGGPFGIAGLVASALGLLALDGVIRSGAEALGDAGPR